MPKRTNFFQKLIYQLHKQLSDNATVTESKMLIDKDTGSLVEVDIVIESNIGLVPITIGIECTSKSRPATLEWYRQLVKKHADLPISKTVLVSESGFTKDVYKKAKINNVELLTLEEAMDTRWHDIVNKINNGTMVNIGFRASQVGMHFNNADVKNPSLISFNHESLIDEFGSLYKLPDYAMKVVQQAGVTRWVLDNYTKLPEDCNSLEVSFEVDTNPKLVLPSGDKIIVQKFDVKIEFKPNESSLKFNSGSYFKQNVAYSEFDNIFSNSDAKSILTFTEDQNGKMKGQVTYVDNEQKEATLELEFIDGALKI
ncbi:hypothetical protein [Aliivibrio fischeri]|uniref:hypothetical protein n=1 Tax=Aliivibrio fischeri TaxID=668 RepID=UPI001F1D48E0|nr:hypothetical protein [Aliivibrio fischeri]MCE4937509.1 hypothetical protein [Aliivibrio fischeri]